MTNIRELKAEDVSAVADFYQHYNLDYLKDSTPPLLYELFEEKEAKTIFQKYLSEIKELSHYKVMIAEKNKQIVGLIIGNIMIDKNLKLGKIGVLEDWGVAQSEAHQGIGTQLYQALEIWFKGAGCQQIHSTTWISNRASRDAHLKMGFIESAICFRKKIL